MKCSIVVVRWLLWTSRHWLLSSLVGLVLSSALVGSAGAADPPSRSFPGQLTLHDRKLTAQIVNVPLQQVMEEVSRLTGAQTRWLTPEREKPVSAQFADVPLSEALGQILKQNNFVLFYSSTKKEKQLSQIWIFSEGKTGRQPVPSQQPRSIVKRAPGVSTPPAGKSLTGQKDREAGPIDMLLATAIEAEEPSARLQAIGQLKPHVQENAQVESMLSELADSENNPQVQEAAADALTALEEDEPLHDVHDEDLETLACCIE